MMLLLQPMPAVELPPIASGGDVLHSYGPTAFFLFVSAYVVKTLGDELVLYLRSRREAKQEAAKAPEQGVDLQAAADAFGRAVARANEPVLTRLDIVIGEMRQDAAVQRERTDRHDEELRDLKDHVRRHSEAIARADGERAARSVK